MENTMGIDQYGQTYHGLGKYPRKELLDRLGYKRADKMYTDYINDEPKHTGYVIGGLWITLYNVTTWSKTYAI